MQTGWILNLTQHASTPAQAAAMVFDLEAEELAKVKGLLNFEEPPAAEEIIAKAQAAARVARTSGVRKWDASEPCYVMIGGAPYLMAPLALELRRSGCTPVFAFSRRRSMEEKRPDGSVMKNTVFQHMGFIEAVL